MMWTPLLALLLTWTLVQVAAELVGNSTFSLQFIPHELQYTNGHVCIPTVSEFIVENDNDFEVYIGGVMSSAPQFLPLLFQPQTLAPRQSLVIQLLFLPYRVERVAATLTLASSLGQVTYDVIGSALPNPYRLYPFVGHRLQVGEVLEQSVVVHNPFDTALHVREVYTTEDFLTLRLLDSSSASSVTSGQQQQYPGGAVVAAWEVPPHSERELLGLSIAAARAGHFTGYVHVKTDRDNAVLPVEVEVLDAELAATATGTASARRLDFGVLVSETQLPASLDLWLLNSGDQDVNVIEVAAVCNTTTSTSTMSACGPNRVAAHLARNQAGQTVLFAGRNNLVATVAYIGRQQGRIEGALIVTTNHSNPSLAIIEVPFVATVMFGGVGFSKKDADFRLPTSSADLRPPTAPTAAPTAQPKAKKQVCEAKNKQQQHSRGTSKTKMDARVFELYNYYPVAVSLKAVSAASCQGVIEVHSFEVGEVAPALGNWLGVSLRFNPGAKCAATTLGGGGGEAADSDDITSSAGSPLSSSTPTPLDQNTEQAQSSSLSCWLEVATNISAHRIPLYVGDGRLVTHFFDDDVDDHVADFVDEVQLLEDKIDDSELTSSPAGVAVSAYRVHMGELSVREPRAFELALSNPHPLPVHVWPLISASSQPWVMHQFCAGPTWRTSTASAHATRRLARANDSAYTCSQCTSYQRGAEVIVDPGGSGLRIPGGHSALLKVELRPDLIISTGGNGCEEATEEGVTECGRGDVLVRLQTDRDQRLLYRVGYVAVPGGLVSAVSSRLPLVLGMSSEVVIRTASSFPNEVFVAESALASVAAAASYSSARLLRHTIPPSAFSANLDLDGMEGGGYGYGGGYGAMDASSAVEVGVPSTSVLHTLAAHCVRDAAATSSTMSGSSPAMLSCLRRLLTEELPRTSPSPSLGNINGNYNNRHQLVEGVLRLLRAVETRLAAGELTQAHTQQRLLQQAWSQLFPRGFPLPDIHLALDSPQLLHSVVVPNMTLRTPLELLPARSQLRLPVLRADQVAAVYLRVHNPFSFPLLVHLLEENNSNNNNVATGTSTSTQPSTAASSQPSQSQPQSPVQVTLVPAGSLAALRTDTRACEVEAVRGETIMESIGAPLGVPPLGAPLGVPSLLGVEAGYRAVLAGRVERIQVTPSGAPTPAPLLLLQPQQSGQQVQPMALVTQAQVKTDGLSSEQTRWVRTMTSTSASTSTSTTSPGRQRPFLLFSSTLPGQQDASTTSTVLAPGRSALLGPILFAPPPDDPLLTTYSATYFLRNNFTGVERVDVAVRLGAPRLEVVAVHEDLDTPKQPATSAARVAVRAPSLTSSTLTPTSTPAPGGDADSDVWRITVLHTHWTQEQQEPMSSASANSSAVLRGGPLRLLVRVRNSGEVAVPIAGVLLDGNPCPHWLWRALYSRLPAMTPALTLCDEHSYDHSYDHSYVKMLGPGEEWAVPVLVSSWADCALAREGHTLTVQPLAPAPALTVPLLLTLSDRALLTLCSRAKIPTTTDTDTDTDSGDSSGESDPHQQQPHSPAPSQQYEDLSVLALAHVLLVACALLLTRLRGRLLMRVQPTITTPVTVSASADRSAPAATSTTTSPEVVKSGAKQTPAVAAAMTALKRMRSASSTASSSPVDECSVDGTNSEDNAAAALLGADKTTTGQPVHTDTSVSPIATGAAGRSDAVAAVSSTTTSKSQISDDSNIYDSTYTSTITGAAAATSSKSVAVGANNSSEESSYDSQDSQDSYPQQQPLAQAVADSVFFSPAATATPSSTLLAADTSSRSTRVFREAISRAVSYSAPSYRDSYNSYDLGIDVGAEAMGDGASYDLFAQPSPFNHVPASATSTTSAAEEEESSSNSNGNSLFGIIEDLSWTTRAAFPPLPVYIPPLPASQSDSLFSDSLFSGLLSDTSTNNHTQTPNAWSQAKSLSSWGSLLSPEPPLVPAVPPGFSRNPSVTIGADVGAEVVVDVDGLFARRFSATNSSSPSYFGDGLVGFSPQQQSRVLYSSPGADTSVRITNNSNSNSNSNSSRTADDDEKSNRR